jgi:hypothetical protein
LVTGSDILSEQKVNGRCLMKESTASERLEMRWLPVLDPSGRTRMEASWVVVPAAAAAPQRPAVTHAA